MGRTPAGETRQRIYAFVRRYLLAGHTPPSIREIQDAFGFRAPQTVKEHLDALVEQGLLERDPGRARGLRLPGQPAPARHVPHLGRVQAGLLTTAVEEVEGYVAVDDHDPDDDLFALTVRGDSMIDAGILAGDTLVVRRQPTARNGQVVVALVGDEATVKFFQPRPDGHVELVPANPAFQPIVVPAAELHLLGCVVEVRRKL